LGAPEFQPENHNFMISGINLGHLGADLSILRLRGSFTPKKINLFFAN
jgi:hypothetical protein